MTGMRHVLECIDLFEAGDSFADAQHFMEQLFVIDKDDLYLCIVEDEFQLMHADGRIYGCENGANLLYGQIQHDPFGTIFGYDGYLVPSFDGAILSGDAQTQETCTQLMDGIEGFGGAVSPVFAVDFAGQHV